MGGILNFKDFFPVNVDWQIAYQVPEPGVLLLLGAGLIALVIFALRKRKRNGTKG